MAAGAAAVGVGGVGVEAMVSDSELDEGGRIESASPIRCSMLKGPEAGWPEVEAAAVGSAADWAVTD